MKKKNLNDDIEMALAEYSESEILDDWEEESDQEQELTIGDKWDMLEEWEDTL